MTAAAGRPRAPVSGPHLGALWFGLFGAPAAWGLQELAGYAIVTRSCFPSTQPVPLAAAGHPEPITLVLSLVFLLIGAGAGLTAYRSRGRSGLAGHQRAHFMALGGLLVSVIFGINLVFNVLVLFLVPACS